MANKSDFSSKDWGLIKDAPYWVQTALTAAEGRMGLVEKRREAKALADFLANYKSSNELVKAVVAEAKDGKHDVDPKASLETVGGTLEDIADAVEAKTSNSEFDAFNSFLLEAGDAIAEAQGENMLRKKDKVSDEEEEALHLVATALRATAADKGKRAAAAAAEQRARIAAQKKAAEEAAKKKADAAAKAEADRKLAEAQKKLAEMEAAQKREEEAAKKQAEARAARRKRIAEARKKAREAAAKQKAEEKAAEEAAAAKYVVQPGDTLSAIALDQMGNANAWREIYEANKDVIKNPSLIYPGQELTIPGK